MHNGNLQFKPFQGGIKIDGIKTIPICENRNFYRQKEVLPAACTTVTSSLNPSKAELK